MDDKEVQIDILLDEDFLKRLVEIGRLYGWGWSGDYCEIGDFIMELHRIGGVDISHEDIMPYD